MAINHVLIPILALVIVVVALLALGQAIGQFETVIKAVLRPPKDEPYPEPVRLRVIGAAAVAVAIAALSLLIAFLTR